MSFLLKAQNTWENFAKYKINDYAKLRNFDFGPNNESSVSKLSPFITHRILSEYDLIHDIKSKYKIKNSTKFVEEIFWRVYWKGWLELRPQVWTDFIEDLKGLKEDDNYKKAVNGETQIECFNDWVKELKENNYLHNHTRMWFASIWIFTLNLPWQKGAEFFMKHLFDGDAASNTLSWRWVAGLQTKGKHYVAQSWNISKFTNNKYKNVKLNENALPVIDKREYKLNPLNLITEDNSNENLLLFENELNLENKNLKKYKNIYLVLLSNDARRIKLGQNVLDYKSEIINDQKKRFEDLQIIDELKFQTLVDEINSFDVVHPCIGENFSFLNSIRKKRNLKLNFILGEEDKFSWQFSNKGFFNFKNNIPKILTNFNLQ